MLQQLALSALIVDPTLQFRAAPSERLAEDYAQRLRDGVAFPAVRAFEDASGRYLGDGFTRFRAHELAERMEILVDVQPGGRRAAWLCALGANADHGQPRTRDEGQVAARAALSDPEVRALSDRQVAEIVRLSPPTIGTIRKAMIADGLIPEVAAVKGRDGVTQKVTKGKGKAKAEPAAQVRPPTDSAMRSIVQSAAEHGVQRIEIDIPGLHVVMRADTLLANSGVSLLRISPEEKIALKEFCEAAEEAAKDRAANTDLDELREEVSVLLADLDDVGVDSFYFAGHDHDVEAWRLGVDEESGARLLAVREAIRSALKAAKTASDEGAVNEVAAKSDVQATDEAAAERPPASERRADSREKGERIAYCIAQLRGLQAAGETTILPRGGVTIADVLGIRRWSDEMLEETELSLRERGLPARAAPSSETELHDDIMQLVARVRAVAKACAEPNTINLYGYPLNMLARDLEAGHVMTMDLDGVVKALAALETKVEQDVAKAAQEPAPKEDPCPRLRAEVYQKLEILRDASVESFRADMGDGQGEQDQVVDFWLAELELLLPVLDAEVARIAFEGAAGESTASAHDEDAMVGEALDQARARIAELEADRPETRASAEWVRLQRESPAELVASRYPEGAWEMPWWAPAEMIAEAVRRVQQRSKVNAGDPDDLALTIRRQIDRAHAVAQLLGCPMEQMSPSGTLAVGKWDVRVTSTTTRIELSSGVLRVHRAAAGPNMDGRLTLFCPPPVTT